MACRAQLLPTAMGWTVTTMRAWPRPSSPPPPTQRGAGCAQSLGLPHAVPKRKTSPAFPSQRPSQDQCLHIMQIFKRLKTTWKMLFEQLLFIITKRVPEGSVYTTHIKSGWFTYQSTEIHFSNRMCNAFLLWGSSYRLYTVCVCVCVRT